MDFLQCGHTANESKGLAFNRGGYRYVNKYSIFRSWRRDKHSIRNENKNFNGRSEIKPVLPWTRGGIQKMLTFYK